MCTKDVMIHSTRNVIRFFTIQCFPDFVKTSYDNFLLSLLLKYCISDVFNCNNKNPCFREEQTMQNNDVTLDTGDVSQTRCTAPILFAV